MQAKSHVDNHGAYEKIDAKKLSALLEQYSWIGVDLHPRFNLDNSEANK